MGRDFGRVSHAEEEIRLEGDYKSLLAIFMGRNFESVSHAEVEIRLKGIN